jgi:cullin-associated NEDD8-dissociated protein 1
MKNCECAEEGTRNVVAECLGKLALISPIELLPKLKDHLTRPSALIRSTVITAVKFTISDQVCRRIRSFPTVVYSVARLMLL